MLVLEWKERAFIEKVNSRCFCWFPAAILVHQNGAPIWRLHTKLYKGAWNVSANNSETMGHKDLRLGQIVYILVFYNISFSWLLLLDGFNVFFCCVTVKTIYSIFRLFTSYVRWHFWTNQCEDNIVRDIDKHSQSTLVWKLPNVSQSLSLSTVNFRLFVVWGKPEDISWVDFLSKRPIIQLYQATSLGFLLVFSET